MAATETHGRVITAAENAALVGCADVDTERACAFAEEHGIPPAYGFPEALLEAESLDALLRSVEERLAEIWTVDVPDGAVDLRGVPPEERRDRVREGFEVLEAGAPYYLVSDRDPSPVREYLRDLVDDESFEFERFEVER